MRELGGRTAVVTGAAAGIGRGLAERFAREGMRVVLADIEQAALDAAVGELQQAGHEVTGVRVDVSQWPEVESLRDRVVDTYGKVHVLCNNAGVTAEWGSSTVWETTINDWQWVLGVNLWGVIHGIRAFVPLMIEQGEEGHVINTSSVHGLTSGPGISVYAASKHAVTRISEGLFYDLESRNSKIKCSLLSPADVATDLDLAARNRPPSLQDPPARERAAELDRLSRERYHRHQVEGISPAQVAELVIDGIREERFYLHTHPDTIGNGVRKRMAGILSGQHPPLRSPGPVRRATRRHRSGLPGTRDTRTRGRAAGR